MSNFFSKKIAAIFFAAIFIIFLHYIGALPWAERYVSFVLNPIEKIFFKQSVKITSIYDKQSDAKILSEKNKELEQKISDFLVENVNLAILRDENKALREQLQFYTKYNYNKILVNIISKSISTDQRQVITIDAGELSGLKIGQPVIAGEGVIIGKLIEVRENLSYACVATDKNCHLAATVSGGEGLSGLTQGDLELTVNLDFVPQNQAIEISDVIITSGLEAEIPKGLIIGEVQDIKNEPNNLFKTAIINPAIDLNKINIVSVIIN